MTASLFCKPIPLATVVFLVIAAPAWADTVILHKGGRIVGTVVESPAEASPNPAEEVITVQTEDGAIVALPKDEVQEVVRLSQVEAEYEKLRRETPDTVEGHWKLADWCREHYLPQQRETHLRRIIELDPDNQRARAILGYQKVGNEWKTRDEIMKSMGYVLYKGRWMLPQQVQLEEERAQQSAVERDWSSRLHRLLSRLDIDPLGTEREIRSIQDPAAVKPIVLALKNEKRDAVRLLLTDVLGQIKTPQAMRALAVIAVEDPVEEVRLHALDALAPSKSGEVVSYFVGRLRDKDNSIVNRAAEALKRMGDPTAIPALIDALVTKHKILIPGTRPPGAIGAGFSSSSTGKSGMTFGAGSGGDAPKLVEKAILNRAVLDALVTLSGGQNFNFDIRLWKQWYARQKQAEASKAIQ